MNQRITLPTPYDGAVLEDFTLHICVEDGAPGKHSTFRVACMLASLLAWS